MNFSFIQFKQKTRLPRHFPRKKLSFASLQKLSRRLSLDLSLLLQEFNRVNKMDLPNSQTGAPPTSVNPYQKQSASTHYPGYAVAYPQDTPPQQVPTQVNPYPQSAPVVTSTPIPGFPA